MAIILNLETATTNCSVSVAEKGEVKALVEENNASYSHAEQLHLFIEEALRQAGMAMKDLQAVAVSKGPGSYTGLRIGVSAAKGICYAQDIPLISVLTLRSMAISRQITEGVIIPLLDARRMEVYSAVFDPENHQIRATVAEIIDEDSFAAYSGKPVYLVGSGAAKCKEVLGEEDFVYDTEFVPSAGDMAAISYQKYLEQDFEDMAYFEPFYLKDFIVHSKKS